MATAAHHPGFVPAQRARRHILTLRAEGLGRRSISAACDVSDAVIGAIAAGKRGIVRRTTEQRILGVDREAVSDGCLVPAKPTLRRIELLAEQGIRVVVRGRSTVRAATALRIERLYRSSLR